MNNYIILAFSTLVIPFSSIQAEGTERNRHNSYRSDRDASLPWQSMPEIFSKKSAKDIEKEKAVEKQKAEQEDAVVAQLQSQIDQLRDDNSELRDRLQDALIVRKNLYDEQASLILSLEMEMAKTSTLEDTLHNLNQNVQSKQDEEAPGSKEDQNQAEIQRLKREATLLAEALVALQKEFNGFKLQQAFKEKSETKPDYHREIRMAVEDFDLKDLEKEFKNRKVQTEAESDILFTKNAEKNAPQSENILVVGEDFDLRELEKELKNKKPVEQNESDILFTINAQRMEGAPCELYSDCGTGELAYEEGFYDYSDRYSNPVEPSEKEASSTKVEDNTPVMVFIPSSKGNKSGFYISPKKVTNRQYDAFVSGVNYKKPLHWPKGQIPPGMEDKPVVNISYEDAFLYSVWVGKRLPREDELQKSVISMSDANDGLIEWTGTPELKRGIHKVFSLDNNGEVSSMPNSSFNENTGFRLASDSI